MDYQSIIEGLKWVRSPEELEVVRSIKDAEIREDWKKILELAQKLTEPPLREAGLEKPVFYAFQARAAFEILGLVDNLGEKIKEEYGLHPAGQSGIGLNWRKLNERIWVPADYLEATSISKNTRSIFSCDEINCICDATPEEIVLRDKVIYGPDEHGSSQAKIDALSTDGEWRKLARAYSLILLEHTLKYKEDVKEGFRPVLDDLVSAYRSEMKQ